MNAQTSIRLRILPAIPPIDGRQIELQVADDSLQYRYSGDVAWINLAPLSEITGPPGPAPDFRSDGEYIQFRPSGSAGPWTNLIALADITGQPGSPGQPGEPGAPGEPGPGLEDGDKGDVVVAGSGEDWTIKTPPKYEATRETQPRHTIVRDMHFQFLRGRGAQAGETGGVVNYVLASGASAGATALSITAATKPFAGQLITYLGTDGEYYTVAVRSVAGNTINLLSPLEAPIAAGANVWNVWADNYHINYLAARALADWTIRASKSSWRKIYQEKPVAFGGVGFSLNTADNHFNPGSSTTPAWAITTGGANTGVSWFFVPQASGRHKLSLVMAKIGTANAAVDVKILVDGVEIYAFQASAGDAVRQEFEFDVTNFSKYEIRATTASDAFNVGPLAIYEQTSVGGGNWNQGKHLWFGDSWIAAGLDPSERFAERLTEATVVKSGVAGNYVANLVARFATDVAPQEPDYVHVVIGTNDYAAGDGRFFFAQILGKLMSMIRAIGAVPVVYSCSVAPPSVNAAHFALSRKYAAEVLFGEEDMPSAIEFTPAWTALTGGLSLNEGRLVVEGRMAHFSVNIQAATTVSATAGTTYFQLPVKPLTFGVCAATSASNGAVTYGTGLIFSDGRVFIPNLSGQGGIITISGTFLV